MATKYVHAHDCSRARAHAHAHAHAYAYAHRETIRLYKSSMIQHLKQFELFADVQLRELFCDSARMWHFAAAERDA